MIFRCLILFSNTLLWSLPSPVSDLNENIETSLLFSCTFLLCDMSHPQPFSEEPRAVFPVMVAHLWEGLPSESKYFEHKGSQKNGGTSIKWRRLKRSQPFCLWYKQLLVWIAKLLFLVYWLRGKVKAILFFMHSVVKPNYFLG